jgi:NADH oxidoreductase Hcr
VPVTVACPRLRLLQNQSGFRKYSVTSTMTLTDAEIADGYVLACSCHPQGDLVLA